MRLQNTANILTIGLVLFSYTFLIQAECPEPYSHCNLGKPGFVNVHLVPHTHDDVGWLKTVDQYYYGSNTGQQDASVQYILDSVIEELWKDPERRFVYVEMAYFWRWWNEQDTRIKDIVRTLVNERRLEFVIGAWCMSDEATPYYTDMIDQQSLGLRFIKKEFGECARPRAAWQVDPFGHSREQASLFAQFGFDGLFLGRIDIEDFNHRGQTKKREELWQASANLDEKARIFTGILPNLYQAPPGFCFDQLCGDDPFMDDPNLEDYNVEQKVDDFLQYTKDQLNVHKTNNLIMTMGGDFAYSNALMQFKNIDKLIKYVNQRQSNGSNINVFYSTTACYLYSLNQVKTSWSVKTDDFFPYSTRGHTFWTGYFSSRPALKFQVKQSSNMLQAVRQITALRELVDKKSLEGIQILERAMGVLQHHDAVSGTERQHVTNDYSKRLAIGVEKGVDAIFHALNENSLIDDAQRCSSSDTPGFCFCPKLNISECSPIENSDNIALIVYNPLAKIVSSWLRIPVAHVNYKVLDEYNKELTSETVRIYQETMNIPERDSNETYELIFKADSDSLGSKEFHIIRDNLNQPKEEAIIEGFEEKVFKNDQLELKFDNSGNLIKINNLASNISTLISQEFCYYKSFVGNNSDSDFQGSGAYIFRSQTDKPTCLSASEFKVYMGKLFDEIHQIYNNWISQTIRLYKDDTKDIEFNWQVGSIDISDDVGKEVIMKIKSDLNSEATFYTDSNGREMLQRIRNYRKTWDFTQSENISGNYYPVNSRIFIRDNKAKTQLTMLTDRSQGGSSIEDGSLEVMVHRRITGGDNLINEPLNELGIDGKGLIVKGKLNLIFETIDKSAKLHRKLAHEINSKPLVFFNPNGSDSKYFKLNSLRGVSQLPENLHLLTLMRDNDENDKNVLIVRIEHFYEIGEDSILSLPVSLDLKSFLNDFVILGVEELALGANMPVSELSQRLEWNAETKDDHFTKFDYFKFKNKLRSENSYGGYSYDFKPMQIRTFRVWIK